MDAMRSPRFRLRELRSEVTHQDMANADPRARHGFAVEQAKSGHPGMPMGMADVATVLFTRFLKFDPDAPELARPGPLRAVGRARLHAALCPAASDRLRGYDPRAAEDGSASSTASTPGHPEYGCAPGIETTTGPLGQGFGNAVGMALAERLLNRRFGDRLVDHYTYVIASDGDLMEGISHEAASLAGHLRLGPP